MAPPGETAPADTAPAQTAPGETAPAAPAPAETAPAPAETAEADTVPATSPPDTPATPDAGAEPAPVAQLRLALRAEPAGPALEGVQIRSDDGEEATTDASGGANLELSPGPRTLVLVLPRALTPADPGPDSRQVRLDGIELTSGQVAELRVVIGPDGTPSGLELVPLAPETSLAPDGGGVAGVAAAQGTIDAREYGTISGRALARGPGTAVDGVSVFVEGLDVEATSDIEGRFTLRVPVGRHTLWLIHEDFPTLTLPSVDVAAGRDTTLTVELLPPTTQQDDWVIRAHYVAGGVASILEERRKSSTVSDALGSEEIAKSPDSSASSATRRIVGASIVGGQYLFARGLGGRYTNVRLNGVPLPSTDPDLPGFQLDLFPASLLSSLTITKTFSPDIPGDFAGGSLNVITKAFPEKFKLTLSTSVTFNTQTTGQKMPSYRGGGRDALGFDDGTRALPAAVPPERVWTGSGLSLEELTAVSASFPNVWNIVPRTAFPNLSFGASVGDTISGSAGRFGYLLTLGYRHRFERYDETVTRVGLGPVPEGGTEPSVVEVESLDREIGIRDAQIGALGAVSYEPKPGHRLNLVSVLTQMGEDRTSRVAGYSESEGTPIVNTQLRYIERQLLFNQLKGHHEDLADVLTVDWHLNVSRTLRDQPSTRDLLYAEGPNGYAFRSTSGSGERLYSELENVDFGGGLDLEWALSSAHAVKVGYLGQSGSRDFAARRFGIQFEGTAMERLLPPEELFAPENAPDTWLIDELTQPEDGYEASEALNATYAMFDGQLWSAFKLMGGLRLENFHQKIDVSSPFALSTDEPPPGADRTDLDLLPAVSLILSPREDMNVRVGYGGTVARPLVRELAPFLNQDFVRRRYAVGNPDLQRTYIHNLDVRWELFPTPTEVFAISGFYKSFQDPIETVVIDQNGNLSYDNIQGATNYGAELEARFALGTLTPLLSSFNFLANLALIYSSVSLSPEEQNLATNAERSLAGQSPYVANLALGYDSEPTGISVYVYYNVFGRRIQDVGRLGLPDVYEEAFHALDATVFWKFGQFTLGASASNLLLSSTLQTQGGHDFSRSKRGSNFGLNFSWAP